ARDEPGVSLWHVGTEQGRRLAGARGCGRGVVGDVWNTLQTEAPDERPVVAGLGPVVGHAVEAIVAVAALGRVWTPQPAPADHADRQAQTRARREREVGPIELLILHVAASIVLTAGARVHDRVAAVPIVRVAAVEHDR